MTREELKAEVWAAIVAIEGGKGYWGRLEDVVTDIVLAKARRCAEIADEGRIVNDAYPYGRTLSREEIVDAIRREFNLTDTTDSEVKG
jgi:hypothetical protein